MYRVRTLEQSRAERARPVVLFRWFAGILLMYRDPNIVQPLQLWNMDETHVKDRDVVDPALKDNGV